MPAVECLVDSSLVEEAAVARFVTDHPGPDLL
jgi:hypothetical protein